MVNLKTVSSVRTIPLGPALTSALVSHREGSLFTRPEDFALCKQDGTSFNPDVLRKDVLYPTLDRLNIPRPSGASGFHAFGHSAASLVNGETGNLKLTQRFLGHSNVSTSRYSHAYIGSDGARSCRSIGAVYLWKPVLNCSQFENREQQFGESENEAENLRGFQPLQMHRFMADVLEGIW